MCATPSKLKDGTLVACRGCDLCRSNRVNDLVGRCIAEQSVSSFVMSLTLTYAGDVPEAALLYYPHVQLFLKRLRKAGYKVRYICAGEYGTKKGRAHWHIILFFQGDYPRVELDRRVTWSFWPHGLVYFQQPDYKGFAYALKYALKDQDSRGSSRNLAMSKLPPLGHQFFMQLASDLVDKYLPLHSPSYSFAHVRDRKGVPRQYWLQGRMREMLFEEYCRLWSERHPDKQIPWTDYLVERHFDPIARREMADDPERLARDLLAKAPDPDKVAARIFIEDGQSPEKRSLGMLLLDTEPRGIVEAFDNGTAIIDNGEKEWLIFEKDIDGLLLPNSGLPRSNSRPVYLWLLKKWNVRRP